MLQSQYSTRSEIECIVTLLISRAYQHTHTSCKLSLSCLVVVTGTGISRVGRDASAAVRNDCKLPLFCSLLFCSHGPNTRDVFYFARAWCRRKKQCIWSRGINAECRTHYLSPRVGKRNEKCCKLSKNRYLYLLWSQFIFFFHLFLSLSEFTLIHTIPNPKKQKLRNTQAVVNAERTSYRQQELGAARFHIRVFVPCSIIQHLQG